ncbi:MAG: DNA mismatch endonuclease Vsr [Rhodobacteraceae bacterium]|nr:MAG: DNA mismatch endonuclease Vsr [Paracoccaceae bacterium]
MDRSAVMRRVKARDTAPEMRVRRLLRALGHSGYRLHWGDAPGRPDIAFPGRRAAIFVHGCFWHGHACPRGARAPKANAAYWAAKIARNRARDVETEARLSAMGWRVFTVWECALRDEAALSAALDTFVAGALPEGRASA